MKIEDAIKRYESWAEDDRIDVLIRKEHRQMADWLKELKTDRPRGEWKHLKGDEWLCSNCGYVVWTEGSWEHPLEKGKDYCEHCGAKMKGTDDD